MHLEYRKRQHGYMHLFLLHLPLALVIVAASGSMEVKGVGHFDHSRGRQHCGRDWTAAVGNYLQVS